MKARGKGIQRVVFGSVSALSLASIVPLAAAQQVSGSQIEEVIVTGIRASLERSLETKREADSVVDAITAEDIGKFPDKNVAESLQRVPGVSISRNYGEGEKVSIRGTEPKLNRTLLNGHSVATADWFILDELDGNRSFNYLMLPAEVVGQLEVYKSPQADLDEGGIGGTINVHTRMPLDLPEFTASGSGLIAYNDLSEDTDPQFSGIVSWRNAAGTFGVLGGLIKQERSIREDSGNVFVFDDLEIEEQDFAEAAVPEQLGSGYFTQLRDRKGGNLTLQFKPNDSFEVAASGLFIKMDADNFAQTYQAYPAYGLAWYGREPHDTIIDRYGTLVRATWDMPTEDEIDWSDPPYGALYDSILRKAYTETGSYDIDMHWEPIDGWRMHGQVGFTRGEGATENQLFLETTALTGFTYDISGRVPRITFHDIDPTQPTALDHVYLLAEESVVTVDKETYGFVDLEHDVELGVLNAIKFGAKATRHERENNYNDGVRSSAYMAPNGDEPLPRTYCGPNGSTISVDEYEPPAGYRLCGLQDFARGRTPGNFMSGTPGAITNFPLVDQGTLRSFVDSLPRGDSNYDFFNPVKSFEITEETYGGYLMASFKADRWRGNAGVRVVRTNEVSEGFVINAPEDAPGVFENYEFGRTAPHRDERSYTDVLPSFNFVFDLTDDILLRATAARVMSRPDYAQLQPTIDLNTRSFRATSGNVELDPFRANVFNLSFEWYFGQGSLLALTPYYMDIKNYIVGDTFTERHPVGFDLPPDPINDEADAELLERGSCTPESNPKIYTCTFSVTRPTNGEGGTNRGVEFTYQQPLWGGLGTQFNYTYSDAESDDGEDIPGNSEHTANLSVYFENELISTRLSYNYRSKFFDDIYVGREIYVDDQGYLDASFTWNVMAHAALQLQATNLTDEEVYRYYDGIEARSRGISFVGRQYYAGVRVTF